MRYKDFTMYLKEMKRTKKIKEQEETRSVWIKKIGRGKKNFRTKVMYLHCNHLQSLVIAHSLPPSSSNLAPDKARSSQGIDVEP